MRNTRRGALVVGVVVAAALAVSCGEDGGTEVTPSARIDVTVMEPDGSPLPGVTVELFAQGGGTVLQTATTGSGGTASFRNLEAGTYEVEVVVPAGFQVFGAGPTRQTVQATESQSGSASFTLESTQSVVEVRLTSSLTFSPANLTVDQGTTVRWVNDAGIFHTITPDGHTEWSRATVSSAGDSFTHTFENVGTFPYFCEPHQSQGMTGVVTVQAP